MCERTIQRLLNVCAKAITRTDSNMTYDRTVEAITRLAEVVHESETDESTWWLEGHCVDLGSLLVGAYWFFSDYHAGQESPEYRALSILGLIFKPGCASGPEPESQESYVYACICAIQEG